MLKLRRTIYSLIIVLILAVFLLPNAFASLVSCTGTPDSSGNCPIATDDSRMITMNGGVYAKVERKTTNDTLTTAESGTTIIIDHDENPAPIFITLPTAEVGLEYTFTAADGGNDGRYFRIIPQSTDTFIMTNSLAANTFAAGDQIESQGYSGDSLRVICGQDLYWSVEVITGTFSDAN